MELSLYIKNLIKRNGPITIAHYMSIISYHRSFGYYENHKIGEDFITSPQISKSFGGLISIFLYDFYCKYYENEEIILLEMGPGNGEFIESIINIILQIPNLLNKITIYLIENSNFMLNMQKKKLKKFIDMGIKIFWYKELGLANIDKIVFFISNEFFDCLPINQFFYTQKTLFEILVNYDNEIDKFFLCLSKNISNPHLNSDKESLINDSIVEISPTSISITKYINNLLGKFGGLSLIIDYGYYDHNRKSTLQFINNHNIECNIHDIDYITKNLKNFDISAHVNFKTISDILDNAKNTFYTQKEFLEVLNFDKLKKYKKNLVNLSILDDDSSENTMGELFKVLVSEKIIQTTQKH